MLSLVYAHGINYLCGSGLLCQNIRPSQITFCTVDIWGTEYCMSFLSLPIETYFEILDYIDDPLDLHR